jgi:hypothetical protein
MALTQRVWATFQAASSRPETVSSLLHSARREKVQCSCRCKSGLGELSVRPSSYRDGKKGNRLVEALGTSVHHGWVCKPTSCNTCEA